MAKEEDQPAYIALNLEKRVGLIFLQDYTSSSAVDVTLFSWRVGELSASIMHQLLIRYTEHTEREEILVGQASSGGSLGMHIYQRTAACSIASISAHAAAARGNWVVMQGFHSCILSDQAPSELQRGEWRSMCGEIWHDLGSLTSSRF